MFLEQLLTANRYPLFSIRAEDRVQQAFLADLQLRGYDMSTLRFSMFLKGHGTPQKPRVLRLRPGTLHARWGWDRHDHSPDLCSCWAAPASRRDSALFMSLMSSRAEFTPFAARMAAHAGPYGSALQQLKELGWDVRTLKFSVRHLGWLYRPEFAGEETHL